MRVKQRRTKIKTSFSCCCFFFTWGIMIKAAITDSNSQLSQLYSTCAHVAPSLNSQGWVKTPLWVALLCRAQWSKSSLSSFFFSLIKYNERKPNQFFFVSNADNLKTQGLNVRDFVWLVFCISQHFLSCCLSSQEQKSVWRCSVWSAASGPASDSRFTFYSSFPHLENFCISARSKEKLRFRRKWKWGNSC